jgi:uroporphyrinogen decarboxylase
MNDIRPRERFLSVFRHEETDRVPIFDVPNNRALLKRELGEDIDHPDGIPNVRFSKTIGLDAALVVEGGYTGVISDHWTWTDPTHFIDELGVGYSVQESSWPLAMPEKPSLKNRELWKRLQLPDPTEPWRLEQIRQAVAEAHQGRDDDIALVAGMRSAFSVLYISMGIMDMTVALYEDPDLILEMSEKLCEFWTRSSILAAELGIDAVFIANDMGMNYQTIISPEYLRSFFLPQFAKQVLETKKAGVKVILHSCGNVRAILDDLVAGGIDCLNNIQTAAGMDIREIKKTYGDRLALMGNVDATQVMTSNDPAVIEEAVIETIRAASPGGGHILATDHSFHEGIPLENIDIFLAACKKWGSYPLRLPPPRPT